MQLRQLLTDDDAVSPVIGVILMVAITVILAAVIGAFVLGFGGGGPSAPSVQWESSNSTSNVTFDHSGGDTIENPEDVLDITGPSATGAAVAYPDSGLSTGGNVTENIGTLNDGAEYALVWESPDSDSTQELASHTV